MAAPELLPVQGVHPRRHAPRHVPRARGGDGARPVGRARQRVHAPVRGVGRGDGPRLPAGTLAGRLDETDTRLWRSVARYVDEARRLEDHMGVEAVGIDGTGRRGRSCITVVADLVEHDVINVAPGRDPATVERFSRDFMDRNGVPEYVRLVACDMSPGFRKGIREHLPHARRIVDRFHVARHADEAVDKAGKTEGRSDPLLKRAEYLWLRNGESPTELQVEAKRNLTGQRLKTGRACRMREVLQDIHMDGRTPSEAWVRLHRPCSWMTHSRLEPMKDFARMVRRHFAEIVAYFGHPYANAVLEGADGVIRNVRRRARGFRDMDHSAAMICLTCGRLDLKAVTTT